MKPQNPYKDIIPFSKEEEVDLRLLRQGWEEGFKAFEKWFTPNDFGKHKPGPGESIVVISRLGKSCHSTRFNPKNMYYSCYTDVLLTQSGERVNIVGSKWFPLSKITDLDK